MRNSNFQTVHNNPLIDLKITRNPDWFKSKGVFITYDAMRGLLNYLGYTFDRGDKISKHELDPKVIERALKFLSEYAQALRLEATGEYVLVWFDETFCCTNYAPKMSWFPPVFDDKGNIITRTDNDQKEG